MSVRARQLALLSLVGPADNESFTVPPGWRCKVESFWARNNAVTSGLFEWVLNSNTGQGGEMWSYTLAANADRYDSRFLVLESGDNLSVNLTGAALGDGCFIIISGFLLPST